MCDFPHVGDNERVEIGGSLGTPRGKTGESPRGLAEGGDSPKSCSRGCARPPPALWRPRRLSASPFHTGSCQTPACVPCLTQGVVVNSGQVRGVRANERGEVPRLLPVPSPPKLIWIVNLTGLGVWGLMRPDAGQVHVHPFAVSRLRLQPDRRRCHLRRRGGLYGFRHVQRRSCVATSLARGLSGC
jgi:hypothetical protein